LSLLEKCGYVYNKAVFLEIIRKKNVHHNLSITYVLLITYFEYIIRMFKLGYSVMTEKLLKMLNMNVLYVSVLFTDRVILERLKKYSIPRKPCL